MEKRPTRVTSKDGRSEWRNVQHGLLAKMNALNGKMFKGRLLPISGRYGEAKTTHSVSYEVKTTVSLYVRELKYEST